MTEPKRLSLADDKRAQVLVDTADFLLVYKPPKMHSVPGKGESLVDWCGGLFPDILKIGRANRGGEGGILQRLDYETGGLVLFARNKNSFEALLEEQARGEMKKTYTAVAAAGTGTPKGFPPFEEKISFAGGIFPAKITSAFRPFGPKGREVRPVTADFDGKIYTTEILALKKKPRGKYEIHARISLGFRHQIRCHLAWAGFPILNDPVYNGEQTGGVLALRCASLKFTDPATKEKLCFALANIDIVDITQGGSYGNTNA